MVEIIGHCLFCWEGVNIVWRRIECIRVADNVVLLSKRGMEVNEMIQDQNRVCKEYRVKVHANKIKIRNIITNKKRKIS